MQCSDVYGGSLAFSGCLVESGTPLRYLEKWYSSTMDMSWPARSAPWLQQQGLALVYSLTGAYSFCQGRRHLGKRGYFEHNSTGQASEKSRQDKFVADNLCSRYPAPFPVPTSSARRAARFVSILAISGLAGPKYSNTGRLSLHIGIAVFGFGRYLMLGYLDPQNPSRKLCIWKSYLGFPRLFQNFSVSSSRKLPTTMAQSLLPGSK